MEENKIMQTILTRRILTRNNFIKEEKNEKRKEELEKLNKRDLEELLARRG